MRTVSQKTGDESGLWARAELHTFHQTPGLKNVGLEGQDIVKELYI